MRSTPNLPVFIYNRKPYIASLQKKFSAMPYGSFSIYLAIMQHTMK